MGRFVDLTGQTFARLTVVAHAGKHRLGGHQWRCECECGEVRIVRTAQLNNGTHRSCGCLSREVARSVCLKRFADGFRLPKGATITHGKSQTATYASWCSMRQRCENPTAAHWQDYGARGIKVCERWQSFENFLADMGERPSGMSIDRIDNDGNYEPSNCRWATKKQQARNRRSSVMVTVNGRRETLAALAERSLVGYMTLRNRIVKGWPPEKAMTTPARKRAA